MAREDTAFADHLVDLISAVYLCEEPPEPFRRDIFPDRGAVDPLPGTLQRLVADIGTKELKRYRTLGVLQEFVQTDCKRVDFFAGCASRHPDTDRVLHIPEVLQRSFQMLAERFKRCRIAEEAGDAD